MLAVLDTGRNTGTCSSSERISHLTNTHHIAGQHLASLGPDPVEKRIACSKLIALCLLARGANTCWVCTLDAGKERSKQENLL